MARVLVAMANKSSADSPGAWRGAAKQQAIEGSWHGGRVPFGYRAEEGKLVIDPEAVEMVRDAATRGAGGRVAVSDSVKRNERGVLTTHGCVWSDKTIKLSCAALRSACASTGRCSRMERGRRPADGGEPRGPRSWTRAPGSRSPTCSTPARRPATSISPARCGEAPVPVLRADPLL